MTIRLISKSKPVLDAFTSPRSTYIDQYVSLLFKADSEGDAVMFRDAWDIRLEQSPFKQRDFHFDGEFFEGAYRLEEQQMSADGQHTFVLRCKKTVNNPNYVKPVPVIDLMSVPDAPKKKWYQWK